jgi:transposase
MDVTVFPVRKGPAVGFNFLECDREQRFLLPPDMREWLPPDHLAFFVVDSVGRLHLAEFYASYRADGWGRAAFHPEMMVALVLYSFCVGERSTRAIERRCHEDVGFRVVAANHTPDHSTIARFVARHHDALQGLFTQVLALCVKGGLVNPRTVAIDGTRMAANASAANNTTPEQLADYARRVFDEAAAIDAEEDRLYGDRRGDELAEHLHDRDKRLEWIHEQLAAQGAPVKDNPARVNTTDPDSRVMKTAGGYLQGYNAQAAVSEDHVIVAGSVTNDHNDVDQFVPMVTNAKRNLDTAGADPIGTVVADAGYLSFDNLVADIGCNALIAPGKTKDLLDAVTSTPPVDVGQAASHDIAAVRQAMAEQDERRIALLTAATERGDLVNAADALGISLPHASNLRKALRERGPDTIRRIQLRPGHRRPPTKTVALARFVTAEARATYATRARTIEPIFGQIKGARGIRGFLRRGLAGCTTEWMLVLTTHNIRRLRSAGSNGAFIDRVRRALSRLISQPLAI